MKYFCTETERKGTCYHEFQKGKWDGITFWRNDSLLLHDDICWELKLGKLLGKVIPEYDTYGNTEVTKEVWAEICERAEAIGGEVQAAIREADVWVQENFETEEVFYILGL